MNCNTEFLNYIYQNSKMGIDTLEQLINIAEEPEFFKQIRSQLREYEKINKEAEKMLNDSGNIEKDISKMAKVSAYMSIGMKTLTDRSSGHIAEMLIKGSNKGIIELTKHINDYTDVEKETKKLAEKLLKTEQNNIEALKKFL